MRRRHLILSCVSLPFVASAHAHGVRAGELVIDHPYAVPMTAGATDGAAYLRSVKNRGVLGDRLIGATSPRAASVVPAAARSRRRDGACAGHRLCRAAAWRRTAPAPTTGTSSWRWSASRRRCATATDFRCACASSARARSM
jgi:hypothetical protein